MNLLDFVLEICFEWLNLVKNRTSWYSIRNNRVLETPRFCYVLITELRQLTATGFAFHRQLTVVGAFQSFTGVFQPLMTCQQHFS